MFEVKGNGVAGSTPAFSVSGSAPANSLVILPTTGYVGLGTNSPDSRLVILQNSADTNPLDQADPSTSSGASILNYTFGTGTYSALTLGTANASTIQTASIIAQSVSSGTAPNILFTQRAANQTSNTTRLIIDSSGNVGIGTTSPGAKLVVSDTNAVIAAFGRTGATGAQIALSDSVSSAGIGCSSGALTFGANGYDTERARIDSSGTFRVRGNTSNTPGVNEAVQLNGSAPANSLLLDSSGRLLVGTTTAPGGASGDAVIGIGSRGSIVTKSSASVADSGTLDIQVGSTDGGGYQGFLLVTNTRTGNPGGLRTHTTYSVFGRGTDSSIQQIATDNGTTGGATFTVTTPSNGVIRVTNTSGDTTAVAVQFFGGTSL